jgi:hypothetical protein
MTNHAITLILIVTRLKSRISRIVSNINSSLALNNFLFRFYYYMIQSENQYCSRKEYEKIGNRRIVQTEHLVCIISKRNVKYRQFIFEKEVYYVMVVKEVKKKRKTSLFGYANEQRRSLAL